ncbi:MAG: N-formylglutamate amidohydrolase [Sneathiella sp.]|uniref:N-formylglutamate amidohydrolase n=1 Tax=Sneathiella sp. TaxID=1964365 RepID=UPI003002F75D
MGAASNPVSIKWPKEWSLPFIFSSPHSGRHYPQDFINNSQLEFSALRQSEDFLVDELFSAVPSFGAPILCAQFPRAYCDVNREAFELDPNMFTTPLPKYVSTNSSRLSSGIGTIPKVVGAGQEIYAKKLEFEEIRNRIDECYFPYHHALRQLISDGLKRFGVIYLIDCHSMPAVRPGARFGNKRPEIILGNRYGTSCESAFFYRSLDHFESFGYRVGHNSPYAGGFITTHYGKPDKNVHALQIEISRELYMDQKTLTPNEGFENLRNNLSRYVGELGMYDSSLLIA